MRLQVRALVQYGLDGDCLLYTSKASPEISTICFRRAAGRHFRRNRDRGSDHHTGRQNFHFQPEGTAGRHRGCEKSTELPVNI